MKTRILYSIIIICFFAACKKEKQEDCTCPAPASPTSVNYTKLAIGNYWVYNTYNVDTNNIATALNSNPDSIYINRDTVINAKTYFVVSGTWFGIARTQILRDSSNCLVDQNGHILFSSSLFNTVLYTKNNAPYDTARFSVSSVEQSIVVNAGTFTSYDYKGIVSMTPPYNNWGNTRYDHTYFSANIGLVKETAFFLSQPGTIERRLIRFHVN